MHLNELKALHVSEVLKQAEELEIENTGRMRKQELMFAIIKKRARAGEQIIADGVLEILPDGFGFLRSPDTSYTASTDDIYISPSQVRRFNLHTGDMIEGEVRTPKDGERYFALNKLDKSTAAARRNKHKVMFENLTPLFPKVQMRLERHQERREHHRPHHRHHRPHRQGPARPAGGAAQERQDGDDAAHCPRHCANYPDAT
jgi:transcription termination factor Rho